jgi:hypothetical protein
LVYIGYRVGDDLHPNLDLPPYSRSIT